MKRLWICLVLLVVIIAVCLTSVHATESMTGRLMQLAEDVKTAAVQENREGALEKYEELSGTWEKHEQMFALYLRHADYDRLVESIAALGSYVRFAEKPELVAECEMILAELKHLDRSQRLTWENLM